MNKPDNTDGSRGQLTARTDTCHLLQIQSPWTWIGETGQTYSFAAFRTYKKWIPIVLRVPSASTRIFLCIVDTDKYQQSASMCVYWATQDESWGLTFMIYFNMAFKFCRDDATRESYFAALFDCFNIQNIRVVLCNSYKSLPMGVIVFYFVDNVVEVHWIQPIAPKTFVHQLALYYRLHLFFFLSTSLYRVCDNAPNGSSPWGYSRIFSGIDSKL
jgi:hypothetical protein